MFILRTGFQGHSKTLNTIKEVDEKAAKEGRTVYYCNVTGFKPDHPAIRATWVQFEDPEKWFELPDNAMIVIDEAQTWFRVRPQGSKVPDYASRLEIMRKQGHELHCITQSPKLIDAHMRELCSQHIHYHRGQGGSIVKRWVFPKPELEVNKKLDFSNGESSRITIDSTYFGVYESVKEGAGHHFKFRPPKMLFVLVGCVLLLGVLGYRVYSSRVAAMQDPATASVVDLPHGAPASISAQAVPVASPRSYAEERLPRVADVPWSAPMFDELTKPQAYPRPVCIATRDQYLLTRNAKNMVLGYHDNRLTGCRCNSQQGSRLQIGFAACMDIVQNGYFDPARPDRGNSWDQQPATDGVGAGRDRPDGAGVAGRSPVASAAPAQGAVTVIADTSRTPRTL